MGKKFQLTTPRLTSDYVNAAKILRAYAGLIKKNLEFYKRIAPETVNDVIWQHQMEKRRQALIIARRFILRAKRMIHGRS